MTFFKKHNSLRNTGIEHFATKFTIHLNFYSTDHSYSMVVFVVRHCTLWLCPQEPEAAESVESIGKQWCLEPEDCFV